MTLTRKKLAIIVLAAVVLSALATGLASVLIRSPAEVAARTAAPQPTPILVPVEKRRIETKVVSRATGEYGSPRGLTVTRSALKTGPRVITTTPKVGATLDEGAVVMTVSGRPVFLFSGAQPAYRDLGPGVRGADVAQLEKALARLNLRPGRIDDVYDAATGQAVEALYRRAGFAPIVAPGPVLSRAEPLETGLVAGGRSSGGVQLPADEMIFEPVVPLRVSEVKAGLGAEPQGPLITATDSTVALNGSLTIDEARLVKPGMEVRIDEPTLGITAHGSVVEVADRPGTDEVDGFHVFFSASVDNPPPTLVGSSVRMTIPVSSTQGDVLAVPVSAVSLEPDGSSSVRRSVNGKPELVAVQPGVSSDGYVAVTAPSSDLKAGDLVVVGTERR
ncbi:MAG: hypothetical protein H0V92_07080 [Pseudonocardiales bacterium]|nr:hypothetical protein [Pseudonocardiales bacterium]